MPSNQEAAAKADKQESSEDKFDDGSLLTQFIGPGPSRTQHKCKKTITGIRENALKLELDKFHNKYLAETDTLDRASGHLKALEKAKSRGHTPTKMAITIQPLVIQRNDETFKREWQTAVKHTENRLIETVQTHLSRIIDKANAEIRKNTNDTYRKLKVLIDKEAAQDKSEDALKKANNEREQKTELRLKRRHKRSDKETQEKTKQSHTGQLEQ